MIPENYIKMCEKAEEIQKAWKPDVGDWFYSKEVDDNVIILGFTKESRRVIDKGIWLPTQEQLQEMTEGRFHIWGNLNSLSMTASTADRASHQVCKNIDSMNELWLCYVMKEKYNKIWTGQKWVKAEEMIK